MKFKEHGEKLKEFYRTSSRYLAENIGKHDRSYFQIYLDRVKKYVPGGSNILDLGCGTGLSSKLLGEMGFRVTGVDISPLFLDRTNESSKVRLVVADASHLPFDDGSFDVVTCYEFIEHVSEVEIVLTEMLRVTRAGGMMLVLSPNLVSPILALKGLLNVILGRNAIPVVGMTVAECIWTVIGHSYLTAKKLLRDDCEFSYRTPDHTRPDEADRDSIYLACQIDLEKFFLKRNHRIVGRPEGQSRSGKWIAQWIPSVSGECCVVVGKKI